MTDEILELSGSEDEESDFSGDSDDEYVLDEDVSKYNSDPDDYEVEEANDSYVSIISNENVNPLFVSKDGKVWSPQPIQPKI